MHKSEHNLNVKPACARSDKGIFLRLIWNFSLKVWGTEKESCGKAFCYRSAILSPSQLISAAEESALTLSRFFSCSTVCHFKKSDPSSYDLLDFAQCETEQEWNRSCLAAKTVAYICLSCGSSIKWLNVFQWTLKAELLLPLLPTSKDFIVCSLSRSASCFLLLCSSNLICRSSAASWSSLSWAWRQKK